MRPQQVGEFTPASLRELIGRQVADGVYLHAGDAEALGFLQGAAQRQTERFQADSELKSAHGFSTTKDTKKHEDNPSSTLRASSCPSWFKKGILHLPSLQCSNAVAGPIRGNG